MIFGGEINTCFNYIYDSYPHILPLFFFSLQNPVDELIERYRFTQILECKSLVLFQIIPKRFFLGDERAKAEEIVA